tara:strand:- start:9 stop:350 length:342 start_codon:yes stop_codon:yes gene_type:complete
VEALDILATGGSGAVSFAVIVTLLRMLEKKQEEKKAKSNGGDVYTRVSLVEAKLNYVQEQQTLLAGEIEKLADKLAAVHRDLCVFREDMRLNFMQIETRAQTRKEVLREISKE